MISKTPQTAYVWVWLPGHDEPVVAGRVDDVGPFLQFTYGRRYLHRDDAMPLYLPELPLQPGPQQPPVGFDAHGCIRDAAPDAWGQRVILHRAAFWDGRQLTLTPCLRHRATAPHGW